MSSQSISSDFKLLDFKYVNRAKYEFSDLEKVNPRLMVSNCYYAYDSARKYLYYFETPRVRTLTEVYKVGDRFMLDLVVPLGSLFMDYLVSEDETNIAATIDNSVNWFGSQIPSEVASEKYKSSLILRSGGEDPVFRVNIPSYRGKPVLEVYDNMRRPIDISRIKPDMEVACICQKVGIRFSNTTFSGDYDCFKIKITQQQTEAPKIPTGYVFNDTSNEGPNDEVDVNGYAERLVSHSAHEGDGEEYDGEEQESIGSLGDEISETDSVLNDLEEVDFTDGESEELSGEDEGSGEEGEGTVSTGFLSQSGATAFSLNSRPPGVGLEFNVNGTGDVEYGAKEGEEDYPSEDEIELTDEDLEGLEEVIVEEEEVSGDEDEELVNLETGDEGDFDELGLEEVNIDGPVSVEQIGTNTTDVPDIDELGLEAMDLTPSKKTTSQLQDAPKKQPKPQIAISELTDDLLDDI